MSTAKIVAWLTLALATVTCAALASAGPLPPSLTGAVDFDETKLTASDRAANDNFGTSVAISGDTLVVGAPGHDTDHKTAAGQAYVYVRSGTVWLQQATLAASDGASFDAFGTSVAISGDTVVVGANYHATGGQFEAGQAYVYVRNGTTWIEQATLAASDAAAFEQFGSSVAISGDTVIVGEPNHETNAGFATGQAYVYVRSGTTWSEQAKLAASDGTGFDDFGWSVAISGDTAVVGAFNHATNGNLRAGEAYVYVRSGTAWSEQATLAARDGTASDLFGWSVAISGDTVVVGANTDGSGAGHAYVYVRDGAAWSEQAMLAPGDSATGDDFGGAVAISGDTVIVGADSHASGGAPFAGQAYVYVRDGAAWSEQAMLAASDGRELDFFGDAVAISGDTLVVGASLHTTSGRRFAGETYVFVPAAGEVVTIHSATFLQAPGLLSVSASSSEAPAAALFLTVPGCVSEAPMVLTSDTYTFRTRRCSDLDGVTATVTSDHGGSATATIK